MRENISVILPKEVSNVAIALLGGFTVGAILTAFLVSQSNKQGRAKKHKNRSSVKDYRDIGTDANLPHPEKYLDSIEETIIQPT